MTSATIQKSAKMERVKDRLLAAISRLEEAIDSVADGSAADAEKEKRKALGEELETLKTENAALREAAAESGAISAENKALRDANAEAARQVAATIAELQQALND